MESLTVWKAEPGWEEDLVLHVEDWSSSGDSDLDAGDQATRAQALIDQLDQYIKVENDGQLDEYIKVENEESLCGWFEEKTELPLLDELGGLAWNKPQEYLLDSPQYERHTPALIREFETVLSNTLTPPHSPPRYSDVINILEENFKEAVKSDSSELDELVNSRVDSLYSAGERSPDSEWSDLSTAPNSSTEEEASFSSSSESDPDWSSPPRNTVRRRVLTSTEEKKLRKKEQNKNAATRYRQKKKAEQAGIMGEEKGLVQHNDSLKEKVTEMQREIKYLKSLMRDICRAKGLIK